MWKPTQEQRTVRSYISAFRLLGSNVEWNDLAPNDQFREELAENLTDKLLKLGFLNTLEELYCVIIYT